MPFTFFAHQTVVLPLKAVRPRWFDGTALCVGSMAPDLAYAIYDTPLQFTSHTLRAQLLWTLPVAVALTIVWRQVIAAPLGAALPGLVGREIGALAHARRAWVVTATSAVIGGLSHLFLDGFTHGRGWATRRWGLLLEMVTIGGTRMRVCQWLQLAGHTIGTAIGAAMLGWFIYRRRLSAWAGPALADATPLPARPFTIGIPLALGTALGLVVGAETHTSEIAGAIIRASWCAFLGLLVGALLARRPQPAQ